MIRSQWLKPLVVALGIAAGMAASTTGHALEITPQTDPDALAAALVSGGGITVISASLSGQSYPNTDYPDYPHENIVSSGTYTNASGTYGIGPGVVLSSGDLIYFGDGPNLEAMHTMNYGVPATAEQTALLNPISGGFPDFPDVFWDVTQLDVTFTVKTGGVAVLVTFGSEEYPDNVGSMWNDVFGLFVDLPRPVPGPTCTDEDGDGIEECILFDTSPYNIAFRNGAPININHPELVECAGTELNGVLPCDGPMRFTVTGLDPSVPHTLTFIIADATDEYVDSVAYISDLRSVPEPATLALLGIGVAGLGAMRRRRM